MRVMCYMAIKIVFKERILILICRWEESLAVGGLVRIFCGNFGKR